MDIKYYKELVSKLDLSFANKDIKVLYPKYQKILLRIKKILLNFGKPVPLLLIL